MWEPSCPKCRLTELLASLESSKVFSADQLTSNKLNHINKLNHVSMYQSMYQWIATADQHIPPKIQMPSWLCQPEAPPKRGTYIYCGIPPYPPPKSMAMHPLCTQTEVLIFTPQYIQNHRNTPPPPKPPSGVPNISPQYI
jgi:hypothetical protein